MKIIFNGFRAYSSIYPDDKRASYIVKHKGKSLEYMPCNKDIQDGNFFRASVRNCIIRTLGIGKTSQPYNEIWA